MKKIAYISLLCLALLSCSTEVDIESQIVSIASLRNIATNYRSYLLTENIVVEGVVTANDFYGEFSSCLIIEDESSALKVLCEVDQAYLDYPFGARVEVSCSGLYLINHYGALKIGAEPNDEYTLSNISASKVGQYVKLVSLEESAPTCLEVEISELTELHSYRYVQLDNIFIFNANGISTFCERDAESGRTVDTTHTLIDQAGNTMELFVDRLCVYADTVLPTTRCTLQGIVDYYNGVYSLTLTNKGYVGSN